MVGQIRLPRAGTWTLRAPSGRRATAEATGRARECARGPRLAPGARRLGCELGDLGRRRPDLDAHRLQRLLLRLRCSGRAGDDGAGVAHRLAGRSREPCDVGDHGLGHLRLDVARGLLLLVAADLADHDDHLGLVVRLEAPEHVDERRADDGVAADADDRRVAEAELSHLVADLVGERPRAADEADPALAEDLRGDDPDVRLAR